MAICSVDLIMMTETIHPFSNDTCKKKKHQSARFFFQRYTDFLDHKTSLHTPAFIGSLRLSFPKLHCFVSGRVSPVYNEFSA